MPFRPPLLKSNDETKLAERIGDQLQVTPVHRTASEMQGECKEVVDVPEHSQPIKGVGLLVKVPGQLAIPCLNAHKESASKAGENGWLDGCEVGKANG